MCSENDEGSGGGHCSVGSGEGAQSGLWPRITEMWGLVDLANLYVSKIVNWVLVNGRTLSMGRREPSVG